jgi:hypothetical protein
VSHGESAGRGWAARPGRRAAKGRTKERFAVRRSRAGAAGLLGAIGGRIDGAVRARTTNRSATG